MTGPIDTEDLADARVGGPGPAALVVDDAPTVRLYHGDVLRDAGFTVTEAANGYEGLEAATQMSFDLLVVDVNMPEMDGYALVRSLRDPRAGVAAPIVMISTEDSEADAERAYRAGANLYLVKPVAPEKLAMIAGVLTGSRR